jgi:hypothetical protein
MAGRCKASDRTGVKSDRPIENALCHGLSHGATLALLLLLEADANGDPPMTIRALAHRLGREERQTSNYLAELRAAWLIQRRHGATASDLAGLAA